MEIAKDLQDEISKSQSKLRIAIRNHQMLFLKLKADPDNIPLKYDLKTAQNDIISIGIDQKELMEQMRKIKTNATKTGLEDRRCNLTTILNKTRKQSLPTRCTSVSSGSTSDESLDIPSAPPSPNPPLMPHEMLQIDFLGYMGLCTHDVYKELQKKRVERKRRSTANPHFLYGNRWENLAKRKKNAYLLSLTPPNTRQAVKKLKEQQLQQQQQQQNQQFSPPSMQSARCDSRSSSPVNSGNSNSSTKKSPSAVPIGLNIPNLPSGLTIERINGNKSSPDARVCIVCRTTGSLTVCESCNGYFHVRCHNRPLVQQPRQCPKCLSRKDTGGGSREIGALSVPPSMTVLTTYVSAEVKEKAEEKRALLEQNQNLVSELEQLESHANKLSQTLHNQKQTRNELLEKQQQTEKNIRKLLNFINVFKGQPLISSPSPHNSASSSPCPVEIFPIKSKSIHSPTSSSIKSLEPHGTSPPDSPQPLVVAEDGFAEITTPPQSTSPKPLDLITPKKQESVDERFKKISVSVSCSSPVSLGNSESEKESSHPESDQPVIVEGL